MGRRLVGGAALAVLLAACSNGEPPPSVAGTWTGTITCYGSDSPLSMSVDAAQPSKARLAIGEDGIFPWDASLAVDASGTITIKSNIASGDAQLLTGKLDGAGDVISGEMDKRLCNKFTLKRVAG